MERKTIWYKMGPPRYGHWFINHEITPSNYSYIYYKATEIRQLNAILGTPSCRMGNWILLMGIYFFNRDGKNGTFWPSENGGYSLVTFLRLPVQSGKSANIFGQHSGDAKPSLMGADHTHIQSFSLPCWSEGKQWIVAMLGKSLVGGLHIYIYIYTIQPYIYIYDIEW